MGGPEATRRRIRPGPAAAAWTTGAAAWLGFWFWAFSFAYSDSFFEYDRCSRISVFGAALFGALVEPASAYGAWRRQRSVGGALALHVAGLAVALSPLLLVSYVLSRASGPCHLEADDAMGAGIDFLILLGMAAASLLGLVLAWTIRAAVRARRSRSSTP